MTQPKRCSEVHDPRKIKAQMADSQLTGCVTRAGKLNQVRKAFR